MTDLNRLSAREAARRLAAREITCEALVRACLERIDAREGIVGAWACCQPDHVLAQARALDAGAIRGPLHGVPFGVKDVIDTADLPTQYGSPIYPGHQPAWDAACVAMARNAGAILLGKTVTAELATPKPGKTANPHDPRHTPGGSSSGSAAAVADCMVPLALGTQTGGSLIRPSSYCGVVGYKPSAGVINRAGVKQVSESLDTVGVMARSVGDAALFAAAVSGRPELAEADAVKPVRIGIWRGPEWTHAAPEALAAVEQAACELAQAGCRVHEVAVASEFNALAPAHQNIQCYEMVRALAYEYAQRRDLLSPGLQAMIEYGLTCSTRVYAAAFESVARCGALLRDVLLSYDVLLTASAPGEAPAGLAKTGEAVFNRPWTMLGVPCVTLPGYLGPHGLPVGVQVVGPRDRDTRLLAAARWIGGRLPKASAPTG